MINNLALYVFFLKLRTADFYLAALKYNKNLKVFVSKKFQNNFKILLFAAMHKNFYLKSIQIIIFNLFSNIFKSIYLNKYKNYTLKTIYSFYSFYINSDLGNKNYFYKFTDKIYMPKKYIRSKKNSFIIDNFFFNLSKKKFNKLKLSLINAFDCIYFVDDIYIKISSNKHLELFNKHYTTSINTKIFYIKNKKIKSYKKIIFWNFFMKKSFKYKFINKLNTSDLSKIHEKYFKKKYMKGLNYSIYNMHKKRFVLDIFNTELIYNTSKTKFYISYLKYNKIKFSKIKQKKFNVNYNKKKSVFKNYLLTFFLISDFYILKNNFNYLNTSNIFSTLYFSNHLSLIDYSEKNLKQLKIKELHKNNFFYTNHYPVFFVNLNKNSSFFKKFKAHYDIDYLNYFQFSVINYLEFFFKKNIFLKVSNNFFKKYKNFSILKRIFNDYKNFQPRYLKNYLISDLLELVWCSFFLKDLTFISNWISKFMESTNFKNHKKFLMFFQNFIKKYANTFIDTLGIKGFFFDVRGKVGVTGSSKKRHISFKIGNLGKSNKTSKIDFNQNLIRTYSGVLGVTYMLSY